MGNAPENQFFFFPTADGSPTLAIGSPIAEKMHNVTSAFDETRYVYGTAVERALEQGFPPRFLSVGLGLGYVEMMTCAQLLRHHVLPKDAFIKSFESEKVLVSYFTSWIKGECIVPPEFEDAYRYILKRTSEYYDVPITSLKEYMHGLLNLGTWKIEGSVDSDDQADGNREEVSVIFFDAFSKKASPELWTEDFLRRFLKKYAGPASIFATYSASSDLKRALGRAGFQLLSRPGFGNKRECTFAVQVLSKSF